MSQSYAVMAERTAPIPALPPAEGKAMARARSGPLRLFLVEDSKLYRERLAEHLAFSCGTQLVGWADCEQTAIDALRRCEWDVLIVDLQLKQGTGLGVLRSLHEMRRAPGSMTIMLTDHDFYLYRRKAKEVGADLFCVKGRDFDQVVLALRQLAGRRVFDSDT